MRSYAPGDSGRERLLRVTFPDGGRFCIYMRWLSVAYGTESARRHPATTCFGYHCALDIEADLAAEFRAMDTERQIAEARKLPLEKFEGALMLEGERLTFGDMIDHAYVLQRGPATGRYTQADWEAAGMESVEL